jgi:hypothetical protein
VTVEDLLDVRPSDVFTILTSDSGLSGFFANAVPNSQGMATLVADVGTFTLEYLGSAGGPSEVVLTNFVATVPEPSGLRLLASGVGAVGLVALVPPARRRRGGRLPQ